MVRAYATSPACGKAVGGEVGLHRMAESKTAPEEGPPTGSKGDGSALPAQAGEPDSDQTHTQNRPPVSTAVNVTTAATRYLQQSRSR
jgi:hypothetical protein